MARTKKIGQESVEEKHPAEQQVLIEQRVNIDDIPF
jgi:hypothetical protein